MRFYAIGGVLCLILGAAFGHGGDAPKEAPLRPFSTEVLNPLMGNWQAVVKTKDGWKGTLRGNVALQRDHPEDTVFHVCLSIRYDLKCANQKPELTVTGTQKIALIPLQKGKQPLVQCLRDGQVMQKVFFEEVLQNNPKDKAALKGLAELRPSKNNIASYTLAGNTWTLEMPPSVREMLPKGSFTGPNIDWDRDIIWTKVKSK
jgi:hypothetical protein